MKNSLLNTSKYNNDDFIPILKERLHNVIYKSHFRNQLPYDLLSETFKSSIVPYIRTCHSGKLHYDIDVYFMFVREIESIRPKFYPNTYNNIELNLTLYKELIFWCKNLLEMLNFCFK